MIIYINCAECGELKGIDSGTYKFQKALGKQNFYHKECFMRKTYYRFSIKINK